VWRPSSPQGAIGPFAPSSSHEPRGKPICKDAAVGAPEARSRLWFSNVSPAP
jgi:hypothetical protein